MSDFPCITISPDKLRAVRGNQKQSAVAARIGISKQSLSHYERGTQVPPGNVLVRLMLLYKCKPQDIVEKDQKEIS